MQFIGLDVHKKQTQMCVMNGDGEMVEERRYVTERRRFSEIFANRGVNRVVLEASTESNWVAQVLEELGQEVIVADPNYLPMYGTRKRAIKTDLRDARALAQAARTQVYRETHRVSAAMRTIRHTLALRSSLIATRTKWISMIRAFLRHEGLALPGGSSGRFLTRLERVELPTSVRAVIQPLLESFTCVDRTIAMYDNALENAAQEHSEISRLRTVPGVGLITALSFASWMDGPSRFGHVGQVYSALGLVPRERSSSDVIRKGSISKVGPTYTRSLLVETAWRILRMRRSTRVERLQCWAERIAQRRGKKVAAVALARKLSGILYALSKHQIPFDPSYPVPIALAA